MEACKPVTKVFVEKDREIYINSISEYTSVEVLAVHAKSLEQYSGVHTKEEYKFIGYDIVTASCHPIKEELFVKKIAGTENKKIDKFASWLNGYGLFSKLSVVQEFLSTYLSLQKEVSELEPIDERSASFISVGTKSI